MTNLFYRLGPPAFDEFNCLGQALHRERFCPEIIGSLFDRLYRIVELWLTRKDDYRNRRVHVLGNIKEIESLGSVAVQMKENESRIFLLDQVFG